MNELTIKTVAQLTQLSEFTLRAWEKRYAAVKPRRTASGYRTYSWSDVEKLKTLKSLVGRGHSIGQIALLSLAKLTQLEKEPATQGELKQAVHLRELIRLLADFELSSFATYLRQLQMHFETRTFLLEVIAPLLMQIGEQVSGDRLDIFQEHAASAVLRNLLSGILYLAEQGLEVDSQYALVACTPEKDLHEFGVLICAILAHLKGHRVLYLGPNMPMKSVLKACSVAKPKILLLGISAPEESCSFEELSEYLQQVDLGLPKSTRVWLGGRRSAEFRHQKATGFKRVFFLKNLEAFDHALQIEPGLPSKSPFLSKGH